MAVGNFEVYKAQNGKWRFRLKAGNGEIICQGEEYETKQGCLKGVASIQRNAAKAGIIIIDDSEQKGQETLKPKNLIKKIIVEESSPTEKVTNNQRNEDEKKILVDPKGAKIWQPRKINLPGEHGPRWL